MGRSIAEGEVSYAWVYLVMLGCILRCICCSLSGIEMCPNGGGGAHTRHLCSREFVGLILRNTDKRRCLLDNPSEMLTKASLVLLLLSIGMIGCCELCSSNTWARLLGGRTCT